MRWCRKYGWMQKVDTCSRQGSAYEEPYLMIMIFLSLVSSLHHISTSSHPSPSISFLILPAPCLKTRIQIPYGHQVPHPTSRLTKILGGPLPFADRQQQAQNYIRDLKAIYTSINDFPYPALIAHSLPIKCRELHLE